MKEYELTPQELEKLQEYIEPDNESIEYETIDGKWWLFATGKPVRPLSDKEAVDVIWGKLEAKPYELTGEQLEKLQEYDEPSNESIGYEKNIAHEALRNLVKWLDEPCIEHIYPDGAEIKKIFGRVWKHYECDICWQSLLKDFGL